VSALLSAKETCRRLSLSRTTLWRRCRTEPGFPQPRRLSENKIAFLEAEVESYIENLPLARPIQEVRR
jgi:predicted DNA-binding transcriptional regulator AlpA